jgi:hypothetical protein
MPALGVTVRPMYRTTYRYNLVQRRDGAMVAGLARAPAAVATTGDTVEGHND